MPAAIAQCHGTVIGMSDTEIILLLAMSDLRGPLVAQSKVSWPDSRSMLTKQIALDSS